MRLKRTRAIELLNALGVDCLSEPPARESIDAQGALLVAADPVSHQIVVMMTRKMVTDWGELSQKSHKEVAKDHLGPGEKAHGYVGRELARRAGFKGADQTRLEKLVMSAIELLVENDALWVEFNPFVTTVDGKVSVLQLAIDVDENAVFRHPALEGYFETPPAPGHTELEKIAREHGLEYLELDGDIGIIPGGIGFGMAAVDIIRHVGGHPANLLDSGGEASVQRVKAMFDLLLDNPRVITVFACRFAGLTKADDWARVVAQYLAGKKPVKPVVLRIAGNDEEDARKIMEDASRKDPEAFVRVRIFYSNTPVDNAAREAVALTELIKKGEDPFADGGEG